jgi:hypothetical protein
MSILIRQPPGPLPWWCVVRRILFGGVLRHDEAESKCRVQDKKMLGLKCLDAGPQTGLEWTLRDGWVKTFIALRATSSEG